MQLSCLRTPDQWRSALARHHAVAKISSLEGVNQITHGRYFWPLEPDHPGNDFDIEFIAHVLAGERRWAGVTMDINGDPSDYSVAQHCVHLADIVNLNRATLLSDVDWSGEVAPTLYGLLHDASEAYLRDVPRPIKAKLGDYYAVEAALMRKIISVFKVPMSAAVQNAVRKVDDMMIFLERDALVGKPCVPYTNENDHPGISIHSVVPEFYVWDAKTAKRKFLEKFEEITTTGGNHIPLNYLNRGYLL